MPSSFSRSGKKNKPAKDGGNRRKNDQDEDDILHFSAEFGNEPMLVDEEQDRGNNDYNNDDDNFMDEDMDHSMSLRRCVCGCVCVFVKVNA